MKGDIYPKIFHEKLTTAKRNQVISMAQNLWTIHQTVSTKGIAKLLDIDLSVLRSEKMSSKEISKVFKSSEKKRDAKEAKEAKVEEFKTMRLNTTSSERKQSGSF